jgi:hypothetical protein
MLSSDFPSALTPNLSSVPAARSNSSAAIPYPKLTRQADPDSISQPIKAKRCRQWRYRARAEGDLIAALDATIREPAHRVFDMEMKRLDEMAAAYFDNACEGDIPAAQMMLRSSR